jgi:formylglycine-generating enzyme required for sulfatase activity
MRGGRAKPALSTDRRCQHCGEVISGSKRPAARFCSRRCQQRTEARRRSRGRRVGAMLNASPHHAVFSPMGYLRFILVVAALLSGAAGASTRIEAADPFSAGQVFRDCADCPEMVVVPSGSFTMGSPESEPQRNYGEAQVRVSIAASFAVGKYAVTFDEWDACVANAGCAPYKPDDQEWGRSKHPVISVNWDDAKAYATWLSRKTGKSYRLLSEAEREYVTRAGTTTPFWWGSSITPKQANYDGRADPYKGGGSKGEYRGRTVPVDSFEPNPWGLYNVHGNVEEWTEDCWNDSNSGNPGDGSARSTGDCSHRVVRGGSWLDHPGGLRSADRYGNTPSLRIGNIGFRLARTLAP